jgi:TolB-like protein
MNKLKITMILLLLMNSGCKILGPITPETGHFYLSQGGEFPQIARVVVFEFQNYSNDLNISMKLTRAVTESLQKKHLFTIQAFEHSDPAWQKLDLEFASSYSKEELLAIRKQLKADAVLYGSVTRYHPYPHLMVGLHLKMVDLRSGKLLWAIEQVWDSTDKLVERRMKRFYKDYMRSSYGPMDWELLVTSPRAFNKFVVYEIAETFNMISRYGKKHLSSENIKNFREKSTIFKKNVERPRKTLKFS